MGFPPLPLCNRPFKSASCCCLAAALLLPASDAGVFAPPLTVVLLFRSHALCRPLEIDMRPICSAGSILYARMKASNVTPPQEIAGLLLSCILSDSLEFRSPTTTDIDRTYAEELTALSGLDMHAHAAAMFTAKADISDLTAQQVVLSDSKVFQVNGQQLRVSVHETTSAAAALERSDDFKAACGVIKAEEGLDDVLFFVVDILQGDTTFVGATQTAEQLVAKAFGVSVGADGTVLLPNVLSRKKQIMPALERAKDVTTDA